MKSFVVTVMATSMLAVPVVAAPRPACALIDRADVAKAFGTAFMDGKGLVISSGGRGMAAVSQCDFSAVVRTSSDVHRVSLMARFASSPDPQAVQQVRGTMAAIGEEAQPIPGIGDAALFGESRMGDVTLSQLQVFKAGTITLTVTVDAGGSAAPALGGSRALALKALSNIAH